MLRRIPILAALLALTIPLSSSAQVPGTLGYSGQLWDDDGPVTGQVEIDVSLFNALEPGGDEAVWSESHDDVQVDSGYFTISLGSETDLNPLLLEETLFLELTINDEALSPRIPLESVPYAVNALIADEALSVSGLPDNVVTADDISDVVRDDDINDVVRDDDITDVVRESDITDVVRESDITDLATQTWVTEHVASQGFLGASSLVGTQDDVEADGVLILPLDGGTVASVTGFVEDGDTWLDVSTLPRVYTNSGNLALGATVTGPPETTVNNAQNATDGSLINSTTAGRGYAWINTRPTYFHIDLGEVHDITHLRHIWYYADGRRYQEIVVQVAQTVEELDTPGGGTIVFNNSNGDTSFGVGDDPEQFRESDGFDVFMSPTPVRFIRIHVNGSTSNSSSHLVEVEVFSEQAVPSYRMERTDAELRLVNASGAAQTLRLEALVIPATD